MSETTLTTLIVDDEPLAVERLQVICAKLGGLDVVGTANDGAGALELAEQLAPDLVLLDMTMPEVDGLSVARKLAGFAKRPAVIFVTAHDHFAVEAFDLDAVDYVLKPVAPERLERAIKRALERREGGMIAADKWLRELWVPHRSELLRIEVARIWRVDAERDYVKLHLNGHDVGGEGRSHLLLQTIAGLEERLDPDEFIRIHRSTILRRDAICALRHDGLGVWSAELNQGPERERALRIGRTYLPKVKAMAGR